MGTEAEAKADRAAARRPYYVFQSYDDGRTWAYVGLQEASSSDQALRRYFDAPPDAPGLYAAVAAGAFRPRRVSAALRTAVADVEMPSPEAP